MSFASRRSAAMEGADDPTGIVQRIRSGDERAFAELFGTYYARLVAFARVGLHRTDVAEEVVQDVFVSLWVRREELVIERSLPAYLFRSVRNRISNQRRALRLETAYAERIVRTADGDQSTPRADARLCESEIEQAVAAALARLPERPRQVFLLNRREHLSYGEIADVLGIAVKTVEMHMTRALAALRESLAEWRQE